MTNPGVELPEPGLLEAVRDVTKKHGIVLIVDEVMEKANDGTVFQVGTCSGNPLGAAPPSRAEPY